MSIYNTIEHPFSLKNHKKDTFLWIYIKKKKKKHTGFIFFSYLCTCNPLLHDNYEKEDINIGRQGNDSKSAFDIPYE